MFQLLHMLRQIDWKTSARQASFKGHWRALLCALIGGVVATVVWGALYPHTFGFLRLWMGLSTGGSVGMMTGALWQLSAVERRASTSGWFVVSCILAWGAFGALSIFVLAPDLAAQERERAMFRELSEGGLSAISLQVRGHDSRHMENPEALRLFVEQARGADLFYPSHEGCEIEFRIVLVRRNGEEIHYDGCVPERHQSDITLSFPAHISMSQIIVPGGRVWLEQFGS